MHIAFDAMPLCPLSRSSSCIALMPNGVAALPIPSRFALMLEIIAPAASESGLMLGNSRRMTGRSSLRSAFITPPSSAIFKSPLQKHIAPVSASTVIIASFAAASA